MASVAWSNNVVYANFYGESWFFFDSLKKTVVQVYILIQESFLIILFNYVLYQISKELSIFRLSHFPPKTLLSLHASPNTCARCFEEP